MGQGRNNVKGYLREHPEINAEIERKIYETLEVEPAPLIAVAPVDPPDGEAPAPEAPPAPEEQAA